MERFFITLQTYTILGIPSFGRFPSLVGFTLIFGFSRKIHQKIMRLLTFLKVRGHRAGRMRSKSHRHFSSATLCPHYGAFILCAWARLASATRRVTANGGRWSQTEPAQARGSEESQLLVELQTPDVPKRTK